MIEKLTPDCWMIENDTSFALITLQGMIELKDYFEQGLFEEDQ